MFLKYIIYIRRYIYRERERGTGLKSPQGHSYSDDIFRPELLELCRHEPEEQGLNPKPQTLNGPLRFSGRFGVPRDSNIP